MARPQARAREQQAFPTACVRKISVTRALERLLKLRKMLRSQRRHRQQPALLQRDAENDRNWDGGS